MNFSRCKSIFQKESKHILRDPFTLILALFVPFAIVLILGNCLEFNLKNISTAVVDHSKTKESTQLVETFNSSGYFKTYFCESPDKAISEIKKEAAKVAIIIPPDFYDKSLDIQILLDGADNSSVSSVMNYLFTVSKLCNEKILGKKPEKEFLKVRLLFNPELSSKWFAVPGLAVVIIAIVSILLTSLTICKEYENGSMELLLSTPVRSSEIIVGKILPYAILGWLGFCIVFIACRVLFEVPFTGSFLVLLCGTAIFILDYLAIGLFISVVAKQQQLAIQMAVAIGLLPTVLLSGFIFPIEYMPDTIQYITTIFPARWYTEIIRGEFLKASSFSDLSTQFSALILQGIVVIAAIASRFKRSLE